MDVRKVLTPLLIGSLISLAGCASLSKDECLHADWRMIGFEDGAKGKSPDYLGEHREACAEYGVVPNQNLYLKGREDGLVEYCRPYNAFQEGVRGATYQGVCPAYKQDAFLEAYQYGKKIHEADQKVNDQESNIKDLESSLSDIKTRLKEKEASLVDSKTTTSQRVILLQEIKDLSKEQGEKGNEIQRLREDLVRLEMRAQHLKAHSPY